MTAFLISASADFYPEGRPDGLIEWTFITDVDVPVSAGLFELRFIRVLGPEEREERDYITVIRNAKAAPPTQGEGG